MTSTNIQIAIRVRPFIGREKREKLEPLWLVRENSIVQCDSTQHFSGEPYSFDHIFDDAKSNRDVYDTIVKPLVMSCFEGINSTIFAYGQTSSGKTYTMLGDKDIPGIISFTVEDIFKYIEENTTKNFLLRCSYLEIYNEKINDLLDTNATDLKIREGLQGVYVVVREEVIREPGELFGLMKKGMKTRKIGCTDMNERSSRSHTIFKLVIQSQNKNSEGSYTESTLSLVDLAGSERVGQMNLGRERQAEGVSINKSLTTLGLVIRKLSENESFINYRDSNLTRLLQHSLGGNSRTLIIATVTVAAAEETKSTLEFAQRAKYVKNRPIINQRVTDKNQLKHLCETYKGQIENLILEKIERDKVINALEDKISNIKIFAISKEVDKPSRIPQRRHTFAHYKPTIMDSGGIDENGHNEDNRIILSPVKSELCFPITDVDDKENSFFDEFRSSTPPRLMIPKDPNTPKTPSANIRLEKDLLDESFINHEKQFEGESGELGQLRSLTERLRNEHVLLREENLKRSDICTILKDNNNDVYEKLMLLQSILEVKHFEENYRHSLHTIVEEELQLFDDDLDSSVCSKVSNSVNKSDESTYDLNKKCAAVIEENEYLKQEINEKLHIIDDLKNELSTVKLSKDVFCSKLEEENKHLKSQINIKNTSIDKLKAKIKQDTDVKEAELEIFTNKITKLNDYKEEMHRKLSDLQKENERLSGGIEVSSLVSENQKLKEDLKNLRMEHDELKQFTEYEPFKIAELEEQIRLHLKENNEADRIIAGKQLELDVLTKTNENLLTQLSEANTRNNEYISLKQENAQIKSELEDTKFLLSAEQKELEKLNQELKGKAQNLEVLEGTITSFKNGRGDKMKEFQELNNVSLMLPENVATKGYQIIELIQENANFKQWFEQNVEEVTLLKETCESLQQELRKVKVKLEDTSLKLEEKTDLYNTILTNYSEKGIEIESLMEEIQELKNQLDYFAALPSVENLQQRLEQQLKENEALKKEKEDVIERLKSVASLEQTVQQYPRDVEGLRDKCDHQKIEIDELTYQLKDTKFLLNVEQKELEKLNQELEEKAQNLEVLERTITSFKNSREKKMKEFQELNDVKLILRKNITTKEKQIIELMQENANLKQRLDENVEEVTPLKETCESLQQELRKTKKQLEETSLNLDEKTDLYKAILTNYSEKSIENDSLMEEIQELKNQLDYFGTLPSVESLQQLLEQQLKENEILKKEREDLIQRLNSGASLEQTVQQYLMDIEGLRATSDYQKTEIDELKCRLHAKINESDEKTDCYNELLSKYNAKVIEYECLINENTELRKELDTLSEVQQNQTETLEIEVELNKLKKDNEDLLNQLNNKNNQMTENGLLKKENELFKSELQDALFQLSGEQKELENTCRQLEEKTRNVDALERIVSSLKNNLEDQAKKLQQITIENSNLQEDICKKEEEIKSLQMVQEENVSLRLKITELDHKTDCYDDLQANYNAKVLENEQILKELKHFEKKKKEFMYNICLGLNVDNISQILEVTSETEKTESYDVVVIKYQELLKEIENLKATKKQLEEYNKSFEEAAQNYAKNIEMLQVTCDVQKDEISELRNHLHSKLAELTEKSDSYNDMLVNYNAKVIEYECLEKENAKLKKQLNSMSEIQLNSQRDKDISTTEISCTENSTEVLNQEKVEPSSRQSSVSDELKSKLKEIDDLKSIVQELKYSLSDTKRQLKERCQDYFHLKFKYNALELQLLNCKKGLTNKEQELEKEKNKLDRLNSALQNIPLGCKYLSTEEQVYELISKTTQLNQELDDARKELKSKSLQIATEKEEIHRLKSNVIDVEKLQFQYKQRENEFEKVQQYSQELHHELEEARRELKAKATQIETLHVEIQRIRSSSIDAEKLQSELNQCKLDLDKIQQAKSALQEKLYKTESKVITLERALKVAKSDLENMEQLNYQLTNFEKRYSVLESQLSIEKSKVESISQKFRNSEREVVNLQVKVYDLMQYKKRTQEIHSDKNPVSRLSAEGRLSPNDLRRIKRQSIHDQRRGLTPDRGNSFEEEDLGCNDCVDIKTKLSRIEEENKLLVEKNNLLSEEIEHLKDDYKIIDQENDRMLKIMEEKGLDLYGEPDKLKGLTDTSSSGAKLNKVRTNPSNMEKNEEVQNKLLLNKKVIEELKNRIAQLESKNLQAEYENAQADSRNCIHKEDKATEATCDLHKKYNNLKKLVVLRRREGNYLRAQLNMPPDCPVLPEDVQREQIPGSLKDNPS